MYRFLFKPRFSTPQLVQFFIYFYFYILISLLHMRQKVKEVDPKEKEFIEKRRASLKNEYAIAQEML